MKQVVKYSVVTRVKNKGNSGNGLKLTKSGKHFGPPAPGSRSPEFLPRELFLNAGKPTNSYISLLKYFLEIKK